MTSSTDWWAEALSYVGDKGATPTNLAQWLDRQRLMQIADGDKGDIRIPPWAAKMIVEALLRTPQSKSDSRISWGEHQVFDVLILKGKRHREELIASGTAPLDATVAAAEWLKEVMPDHSLETIQRALMLADTGEPFRNKSRR